MKKLALLVSFLISTNSVAGELHNFNEVKTAIVSGKTIHIAIDFSKCSASNKGIAQSMSIGVFTPTAIVVTDHIATSLTHFTLNNGKPVYEFVRYTITDDNNVNVTNQVLDAVNYTPIADKSAFNCKLETGAKIFD